MAAPATPNPALRGIALILGAVAIFAVMDTTAKYLGRFYPMPGVIWARYAVNLVLLVAILAVRGDWRYMRTARPGIQVAVVMERVLQPNRWEDAAFRVIDVIPDEGAYGNEPRKMFDDGKHSRWLFPGFRIELFADECKG